MNDSLVAPVFSLSTSKSKRMAATTVEYVIFDMDGKSPLTRDISESHWVVCNRTVDRYRADSY